MDLDKQTHDLARRAIMEALTRNYMNKGKAAKDVGWKRTRLVEWLRRHYPHMLKKRAKP